MTTGAVDHDIHTAYPLGTRHQLPTRQKWVSHALRAHEKSALDLSHEIRREHEVGRLGPQRMNGNLC
jgi:hypothetical protein